MKKRATPALTVVDSRAALEFSDGCEDLPALYLEDGVLATSWSGDVRLWSQADQREVDDAAQRHSEKALAVLDSYGEDPRLPLEAVVIAASKLIVYQALVAYLRTQIVLERAIDVAGVRVVRWSGLRRLSSLEGSVMHGLGLAVTRGGRRRDRADWSSDGIKAWLKESNWEWSARALAGHIERIRSPDRVPERVDALSVFDVRNAGMIANVALVSRALRQRRYSTLGVSMHRGATPIARATEGSSPILPFSTFSRIEDIGFALNQLGHVYTAVQRSAVDKSNPRERAATRYAFSKLHRGYVGQTLLDFLAARRMLGLFRPRAVLLASDAHRYSRLILLAARSLGAKSFVIQHGALVIQDFYVPVVADHMLAWGPFCRVWFLEHGTPGEKVSDVGFVRGPERLDFRIHAARVTRLLFAAQPIADRINGELLERVRAALEADPDMTLTVRPHPGEGRRAVLEHVIRSWPATIAERCTLSPPGQPLAVDLAASDAVLIAQSTVGIDALAAGLPVILLRHRDIDEPIPFLDFHCVVSAADRTELVQGLKGLKDSELRRRLSDGAGRFLEDYIGRAGDAAIAAAAESVERLAGLLG